MATDDDIGDLLRAFYRTFGMPTEGPPPDVNVASMSLSVPEADIEILRRAMVDERAIRDTRVCREILENLATDLSARKLLLELKDSPLTDAESDNLSSGVFWFALAGSLNSTGHSLSTTPLGELMRSYPVPLQLRMAVHGSLVLRLYVALVYMREGVLAERIKQRAASGGQCAGLVRRLLLSDFVRRVRNALSHGSFAPCIAGIEFRDDHGSIVATPGFLEWLCTWLLLIQLQTLCASHPGAAAPRESTP